MQGEIYVVGGAAIALAFDPRRTTKDIDAVFEPKALIYREAEAMSQEHGLARSWLNDAVKGFLVAPDPGAAVVLDVPGLRCSAASPRLLPGHEGPCSPERRGRGRRSPARAALSLTTAEQVLDVAEEVYGDRLDAAAQFFVEALFDQV